MFQIKKKVCRELTERIPDEIYKNTDKKENEKKPVFETYKINRKRERNKKRKRERERNRNKKRKRKRRYHIKKIR